MTEIARLLELIYDAHRSFVTATGVLREWRDQEVSDRAMRAVQEREARRASGRSSRSMMVGYAGSGSTEPLPRELENRIRFWFEKPERFREEHSSDHPYGRDGLVAVRDGQRWWSYDPRLGASSNESEPEVGSGVGQQVEQLLDPIDLLAGLELTILGDSELAGHAALAVRAVERPVEHHHFFHRFPFGGNEFRYLVDAKRGVLLRKAFLFDGAEFSSVEFLELAFDEPIPPETFTLTLPQGEEFVSPVSHRPMTGLSIDEAAQRASFPVFVVPQLPEGQWRMMVVYVQPSERPPVEEMVHVNYIRDDAQQHLTLAQRPATDGEARDWSGSGEPEQVIHGGNTYLVSRGEGGTFGPPTTVWLTRGETSIQMSSQNLGLELLLELADSLVAQAPHP